MNVRKMKINEMNTIAQLTEASEYEKFSLVTLIKRAREIGKEEEVKKFVELCKSYDSSITAGSWSKSPSIIR